MQTKICIICNLSKSLSDFYWNRVGNRHSSYCKSCEIAKKAEWKKNNPERQKLSDSHYRIKNRIKLRLIKTGCALEQFEKMQRKQKGHCLICGKHQTELKFPLGIDHNHKTGEIRGLLCRKCNAGIGYFDDNPNWLLEASLYLQKRQSCQNLLFLG